MHAYHAKRKRQNPRPRIHVTEGLWFGLRPEAPRHGLEEGVNSSGNVAVSETGGAESGAVGAQNRVADAELARIIDAWPTLSAEVKTAIVQLVKNSSSDL